MWPQDWVKMGQWQNLATATPERPSPVSVLDATFYRDDSPSPVKKISNAFKDDETLSSEEPEWTSVDLSHLPDSTRPSLSFDINHEKLENIKQLVQKIRQLNSTCNEPYIDYIAPICENSNPDHKYISEILLASGLLRDCGSGLTTIQLRPIRPPYQPQLVPRPGSKPRKNLSFQITIAAVKKIPSQ
ncbi:hypothetical protein L1049_002487 [Liquidambar formosana]|uniref:Uncharacterized protein n=1 Tax=Liquidambar formosana TaxID=63359 RepID=A0AAP0NF02_LIQFO